MQILELYKQSRELTTKTKQWLDYAVQSAINITGKAYLDEITIDDINKLKNNLKDSGKLPKTINILLGMLSSIFNFAIDRELFKGLNSCKKIDKSRVDNKREQFLSIDNIKVLKETIKDKPTLLLFVELSLSTGGRLETITSIRKKDINLIAGYYPTTKPQEQKHLSRLYLR